MVLGGIRTAWRSVGNVGGETSEGWRVTAAARSTRPVSPSRKDYITGRRSLDTRHGSARKTTAQRALVAAAAADLTEQYVVIRPAPFPILYTTLMEPADIRRPLMLINYPSTAPSCNQIVIV